MPSSVSKSPFSAATVSDIATRTDDAPRLRTPQVRILRVLMPDDPTAPVHRWPMWTRAMLAVRAGFTAISGTVTRVLNGVGEGSVNRPHLGLLALGYVSAHVLDIEGATETSYRATAAGVRAYQAHEEEYGELPAPRDVDKCTNDKFRLRQLGAGWVMAEDGSYHRQTSETESLKVVKVDDTWVIAFLLDGMPTHGHHYPSFKQLLASLAP